uniref:hypothetical protein n=1 Tax=uncultured Acidovorax sp. TaxID=158751 RepID=UPI0025EFA9B4|nr:hypothetical protein [uncultured Acidovorax sp.]
MATLLEHAVNVSAVVRQKSLTHASLWGLPNFILAHDNKVRHKHSDLFNLPPNVRQKSLTQGLRRFVALIVHAHVHIRKPYASVF